MITRIAGRGCSFTGAGKYYLHDVEADTSERVDWSHTLNVPTDDPEKALKWMAWTDMNRNSLKEQAGIAPTGQKAHAGNVFTYSLSWAPAEEPDRETMLGAALETLELLGLDRHEAVIVGHNDKHFKHLHVIANLVSPEDGRIQAPAWSKLKMSGWAEEFERIHNQGEVICEERAKNNKRRRDGELVKHEPEKHDRAALVEQLYVSSDSGRAFAAALEEHGYTLARGDKRPYVLVDEAGNIYCLSRQLKEIKGHRAADMQAKLADLREDREPLPRARDLAEQRTVFDRDTYHAEQQDKLEQAAIRHEQTRPLDHRGQFTDASEGWKRFDPKTYRSYADEYEARQRGEEEGERGEGSSGGRAPAYDDKHLRELDRLREQEAQEQRERLQNEARLAEYYKRDELAAELARKKAELAKNQGLRGRVTGRRAELDEEIAALQKTLENTDMRIAGERGKLEVRLAQERAGGTQKSTPPSPAPANENTPIPETEQELNTRMRRAEQFLKRVEPERGERSQDGPELGD